MTKISHIKYIVIIAILCIAIVWLVMNRLPDVPSNTEHRGTVSSIAVLPFVVIDGEKKAERLAATITSLMVDRLSHSSQFTVVAATPEVSERRIGIREIGNELSVSHVLEGGVRSSSESARINIQLINARTDEHVWAESYQLDSDDLSGFLIAVENEISNAVR